MSSDVVEENQIEIEIKGSCCSLIQDDITASHIENGRHLILWNGDENLQLWIDRYDVRTLLEVYDSFRKEDVSSTIVDDYIDEDLEYERYQDLLDFKEEQLYETHDSEDHRRGEEWHYKYDADIVNEPIFPQEEYKLPQFLKLPEGVIPPQFRKQYEIIIHTAKNARTSSQLEIYLKLKQQDNPLFSFLDYECEFNPFYEYLKKIPENVFWAIYLDQADIADTPDAPDDNICQPSEDATTAATTTTNDNKAGSNNMMMKILGQTYYDSSSESEVEIEVEEVSVEDGTIENVQNDNINDNNSIDIQGNIEVNQESPSPTPFPFTTGEILEEENRDSNVTLLCNNDENEVELETEMVSIPSNDVNIIRNENTEILPISNENTETSDVLVSPCEPADSSAANPLTADSVSVSAPVSTIASMSISSMSISSMSMSMSVHTEDENILRRSMSTVIEFILRNGSGFEEFIRSEKANTRSSFSFLLPWNPHYSHFQSMLTRALENKSESQSENSTPHCLSHMMPATATTTKYDDDYEDEVDSASVREVGAKMAKSEDAPATATTTNSFNDINSATDMISCNSNKDYDDNDNDNDFDEDVENEKFWMKHHKKCKTVRSTGNIVKQLVSVSNEINDEKRAARLRRARLLRGHFVVKTLEDIDGNDGNGNDSKVDISTMRTTTSDDGGDSIGSAAERDEKETVNNNNDVKTMSRECDIQGNVDYNSSDSKKLKRKKGSYDERRKDKDSVSYSDSDSDRGSGRGRSHEDRNSNRSRTRGSSRHMTKTSTTSTRDERRSRHVQRRRSVSRSRSRSRSSSRSSRRKKSEKRRREKKKYYDDVDERKDRKRSRNDKREQDRHRSYSPSIERKHRNRDRDSDRHENSDRGHHIDRSKMKRSSSSPSPSKRHRHHNTSTTSTSISSRHRKRSPSERHDTNSSQQSKRKEKNNDEDNNKERETKTRREESSQCQINQDIICVQKAPSVVAIDEKSLAEKIRLALASM
eukprot:gene1820-3528_t